MTGTIEFKGDSPFELKLQQAPKAAPSNGGVVLTFPVFVADIPGQVAPLVIYMPLPEAEWLRDQLQMAISVAKSN